MIPPPPKECNKLSQFHDLHVAYREDRHPGAGDERGHRHRARVRRAARATRAQLHRLLPQEAAAARRAQRAAAALHGIRRLDRVVRGRQLPATSARYLLGAFFSGKSWMRHRDTETCKLKEENKSGHVLLFPGSSRSTTPRYIRRPLPPIPLDARLQHTAVPGPPPYINGENNVNRGFAPDAGDDFKRDCSEFSVSL